MNKINLFLAVLFLAAGSIPGFSQDNTTAQKPKVEVYYFHPDERCPIDQSIEENTVKMMQKNFSREIKDGTIKFKIINTDDKSQAKTVARFEINSQALYVVKLSDGKEIKNDLTHFAFSNGQSNPERFKSGLKDEIIKALHR
jgi:hypothetical protein